MTMSWQAAARGTLTEVDWREHLDGRTRLDPYLVWADLTRFRGVGGRSEPEKILRLPLLMELSEPNLKRDATGPEACNVHPLCRSLNIQEAYFLLGETISRFVTGSVEPCMVPELLRCPELVRRFQLGLPRVAQGATTPREFDADPFGYSEGDPVTVLGVIDDGFALFHPRIQAGKGINRVSALWDQNPIKIANPAEAASAPEALGAQAYGFGYGRRFASKQLNDALCLSEASGSQDVGHEKLDYVPEGPDPSDGGLDDAGPRPKRFMRRSSHGAGVLDLAAGHRESDEPDAASSAPLVLVQLPQPTVQDSSGGSLALHVLDALRFIVQTAWLDVPYKSGLKLEGLPAQGFKDQVPILLKQGDRPTQVKPSWRYSKNRVVVNLSYGTVAGPHDGSSMLEMAMEEMVATASGQLHIVVAAGNLHGGNTHAALRMRQGHSGQLTWTVTPDNPMESFLEVWIPGHDALGAALADDFARHFHLRVEPPGGGPVQQLHCGQGYVLTHDTVQAEGASKGHPSEDDKNLPVAGALFCRRVAQGLNGTMLLLAVAPTRPRPRGGANARPAAPHGDWLLELTWNEGPAAMDSGTEVIVHAWTERNDLLLRSYRAQQSKVYSHQPVGEYSENMRETRELRERNIAVGWPNNQEVTHGFYNLASTSNGRSALQGGHVWVVGGYRLSDGEMASYSSGGPARPSRNSPIGGTTAQAGSVSQVPVDPILRELRDRWANDEHPVHARWADVSGTGRRQPDIDAPSDEGSRVRGVLVSGMRSGQWARLSGTSAAAPQVARWLVNLQELIASKAAKDQAVAVAKFFGDTLAEPMSPSGDANLARPTLRPDEDDLYRRGSLRLRPMAVQREVTSVPAASAAASACGEGAASGNRPG